LGHVPVLVGSGDTILGRENGAGDAGDFLIAISVTLLPLEGALSIATNESPTVLVLNIIPYLRYLIRLTGVSQWDTVINISRSGGSRNEIGPVIS
jgi:hypothetical protein